MLPNLFSQFGDVRMFSRIWRTKPLGLQHLPSQVQICWRCSWPSCPGAWSVSGKGYREKRGRGQGRRRTLTLSLTGIRLLITTADMSLRTMIWKFSGVLSVTVWGFINSLYGVTTYWPSTSGTLVQQTYNVVQSSVQLLKSSCCNIYTINNFPKCINSPNVFSYQST